MTNRTPLSRKLRKEAMTPAAPLEKMSEDEAAAIKLPLADLVNAVRFIAFDVGLKNQSAKAILREAARRLAPKMGDSVSCTHCGGTGINP